MATSTPTTLEQGSAVDDTNHDLLHSLSVRLDAQWHDRTYEAETRCAGCRRVFDRIREMDQEAAQLLTRELAHHVKTNKFPIDLSE